MSVYTGLPIYTDPRCQPGVIYTMSDWTHLGATAAIFCHPSTLPSFLEQRWPEAIAEATNEVARALWLESGRRTRDRCSLEFARSDHRKREMRAR